MYNPVYLHFMFEIKKSFYPHHKEEPDTKETRGPRGPWNAHLRQKVFKFPFFIALCTTGNTWDD